MDLFISAERDNNYFIDTIKKYCDNSQDQHSWIYLPHMSSLPGESLSRRIIRYIFKSDLLFVDATPRRYQRIINDQTEDAWFTNQGVLIECAVAITLGRIEDMKIYCLSPVDYLHPVLREKIVDPYPQNDEESFLTYINDIVVQRERDSLALLRQSRVTSSIRSLYPEL